MTNDKDQLAFELASAAYLFEGASIGKDLESAIIGFIMRVAHAEGKALVVGDLRKMNLEALRVASISFALVVRSCVDIDDVLILAAKRFLKDAEGAIG